MYKSLPFPAHPFFKASMLLFFLVFGLEGTWPAKNGGIYANFGRQDWFFQLFLRITEPQNYVVITCKVRQMLPIHKDFCWFESTTPSYKTINWCTEPDFVVYLTYSGVFFNQLSLQKIHYCSKRLDSHLFFHFNPFIQLLLPFWQKQFFQIIHR